jgi:hypothetical protein
LSHQTAAIHHINNPKINDVIALIGKGIFDQIFHQTFAQVIKDQNSTDDPISESKLAECLCISLKKIGSSKKCNDFQATFPKIHQIILDFKRFQNLNFLFFQALNSEFNSFKNSRLFFLYSSNFSSVNINFSSVHISFICLMYSLKEYFFTTFTIALYSIASIVLFSFLSMVSSN